MSKRKNSPEDDTSLVDAFATLRAWRDEESPVFIEPDASEIYDPSHEIH